MAQPKKGNLVWVIQPAIIISGMLLGFNYTRGQQAQVVIDTSKKIDECKIEMHYIREKQDVVNERLLGVIQELKVAVAELRTETKMLNRRRGNDN